MNKAQLIEAIATKGKMSKAQAATAVDTFTSTISTSLKKGDKVTLVGFGTWSVTKRSARNGRNPQTGKAIKIAAKTSGKFTPGKSLKDLSCKKGGCKTKKK